MDERERGAAAGTDETNDFDRVVAVATTLSQPRTAAHIADEALVDEGAAREYLNQLVDLNALQRDDRGEQALYSPDNGSKEPEKQRCLWVVE